LSTKTRNKGNEILIGVIGLICVLVTAGFSNWDKIFSESNVIQAKYSGYSPTDHFETELRHYFNVSGLKNTFDIMQKQLAQNFKMQLSKQYPKDSEKIKKIINVALEEEAITLDEIIPKMLPVYKNHFTLQELQKLNKFYSTETMQNMIKIMPLLTKEAAPLQTELLTNFQKRYIKRLKEGPH